MMQEVVGAKRERIVLRGGLTNLVTALEEVLRGQKGDGVGNRELVNHDDTRLD